VGKRNRKIYKKVRTWTGDSRETRTLFDSYLNAFIMVKCTVSANIIELLFRDLSSRYRSGLADKHKIYAFHLAEHTGFGALNDIWT